MEKRDRKLTLLKVDRFESHTKTLPHVFFGKIIYSVNIFQMFTILSLLSYCYMY